MEIKICEEIQRMDLFKLYGIIYFDINDDFEIVKADSLFSSLVRIYCEDLVRPSSELLAIRKTQLIKLLENPRFVYTSPFDPITFKNSPAPFHMMDHGIETMRLIRERSKKIKLEKINFIRSLVH